MGHSDVREQAFVARKQPGLQLATATRCVITKPGPKRITPSCVVAETSRALRKDSIPDNASRVYSSEWLAAQGSNQRSFDRVMPRPHPRASESYTLFFFF